MNNLADKPEHLERLVELRERIANRMSEVGDDRSLSGPPRLLDDFLLPRIRSE